MPSPYRDAPVREPTLDELVLYHVAIGWVEGGGKQHFRLLWVLALDSHEAIELALAREAPDRRDVWMRGVVSRDSFDFAKPDIVDPRFVPNDEEE